MEATQSNFAQLRNIADSCWLLPIYLVIRSVEIVRLTQAWAAQLLVTFGFVFRLHFLKRIAREHTRRVKLPVTFGATEALKILALNPF
jgi:hypothetical protein